MDILKKILPGALAMACACPVLAAEPAGDFTRGFSLEAALSGAPASPEAGRPSVQQFLSKLRATRDCKFITFKAEDPLVSNPVSLTSYVFEKVCEEYQDGRHCFEKLLRKEHRKISVELTGSRTALPWERDVFGVCLEDTAISAEVAEGSHKYKLIKKPGLPETRIEAFAEAKIAAAPAPSAITAGNLQLSEGPAGLTLELKDKWGAAYAAFSAERTVLKLTLKQDNPAWFDGVVLEKELELAPDGNYKIDFAQLASEFRRPLEAGRLYYVKWGFSRKGEISKKDFVHGGETPRTVFLPR
jgi:hypothetical protein